MVDIQTISIAVASASVVVGIVYYAFQLRHQSKIREMDAIVRMNPSFNISLNEWQEAGMKVGTLQFKDYDDFVEKYGSLITDTPEIKAIHTVLNHMEGVGFLLRRKLVSRDYVRDCFGPVIILLWEKLRPVVEGTRKQFNMPKAWEPLEYLYNEIKKTERAL